MNHLNALWLGYQSKCPLVMYDIYPPLWIGCYHDQSWFKWSSTYFLLSRFINASYEKITCVSAWLTSFKEASLQSGLNPESSVHFGMAGRGEAEGLSRTRGLSKRVYKNAMNYHLIHWPSMPYKASEGHILRLGLGMGRPMDKNLVGRPICGSAHEWVSRPTIWPIWPI